MVRKGAIFDMDGTLLDSMPVWEHIGERYLYGLGITPRRGLQEALRTLSLLQAAEYMRAVYQVESSPTEIAAQMNTMVEDDYRTKVQAKPGVEEFLHLLHGMGVKIGLVTATDRPLAEAALGRLGLLHYFDLLLTCTEFGAGKDRPDIYLFACKQLAVPEKSVIVFEDALHAVKSAKGAGLRVAAVYDKSAEMQWQTIKKSADWAFDDFSDKKIGQLFL